MAEIRTVVNIDLPGRWAEEEARRIHDRIYAVLAELGHEAIEVGHQVIEGQLTRLQVRGSRHVEDPPQTEPEPTGEQ